MVLRGSGRRRALSRCCDVLSARRSRKLRSLPFGPAEEFGESAGVCVWPLLDRFLDFDLFLLVAGQQVVGGIEAPGFGLSRSNRRFSSKERHQLLPTASPPVICISLCPTMRCNHILARCKVEHWFRA